jgi:hypothetical protein
MECPILSSFLLLHLKKLGVFKHSLALAFSFLPASVPVRSEHSIRV